MAPFIKAAFQGALQGKHALATVNIILTLVIALVSAIAAVVQAGIAASQLPPLPQVQATSLKELRTQIEERRATLQREMSHLDELLRDLGRVETILSGSTQMSIPSSRDVWLLTAIKTLAVYVVLVFSVMISIPALAIDLVALIFGHEFPSLRVIWGWSWRQVAVDWYWSKASPFGIVSGIALLVGVSAIAPIFESKRFRERRVESSSTADPISKNVKPSPDGGSFHEPRSREDEPT
ncbi:hypothetical protein [Piscinibacter sp. XHJ-5]|uniref:hypothetical protein n=1 Tax=Piscinibacter sp. XHJ-5 TaxID=3037797 RepID=UPI0024534BC7|nr:hypothetical protein [Piscinibacter sp. XHJ-5]